MKEPKNSPDSLSKSITYISSSYELRDKYHPLNWKKSRTRNTKECCVKGCGFMFTKKNELRFHLAGFHSLQLEKYVLTFASVDEMKEWKHKVEKETVSSFVKRSCPRETSDRKMRVLLDCRRSGPRLGRVIPDSQRRSAMRAQGSAKTGVICPAGMEASLREDGSVHVVYWATHYGHDNDPTHVYRPRKEVPLFSPELLGVYVNVKKKKNGGILQKSVVEIPEEPILKEDDDTMFEIGSEIVICSEEQEAGTSNNTDSEMVVCSEGQEAANPNNTSSELVVCSEDQEVATPNSTVSGRPWDDDLIRLLISKRVEMSELFRHPIPKSKKNWEIVAEYVREMGGRTVTDEQCKNKWCNLKNIYKKYKSKERRFALNWPHFKAMDDYFMHGRLLPPEDRLRYLAEESARWHSPQGVEVNGVGDPSHLPKCCGCDALLAHLEATTAKHVHLLEAMERRQEERHVEAMAVLREMAEAMRRIGGSPPAKSAKR